MNESVYYGKRPVVVAEEESQVGFAWIDKAFPPPGGQVLPLTHLGSPGAALGDT